MVPDEPPHTSEPKAPGTVSAEDGAELLAIARASIRHGLDVGEPLPVDLEEMPVALRRPGASFVTLEIEGALRGCIGSFEAYRPLASDVSHNAYAAAFRDPRFPPLSPKELTELELHLSLLGPPVPLEVVGEAELLAILRPGVDGLILEDGGRRGLFLPQVWEQLPDPVDFVTHLKRKAGLPDDYWSPGMRCWRFVVEKVAAE
ncbi:MAG: AmmeMemoRadiSam system protein A [Gemmatimonadota bacterium]|nr:MAG: AmmeMemoRadiSam system protein A [Gemmatimonadota bacterium]